MTEPDFLEIVFSLQKQGKIGQAQGSLKVQGNLVDFFTIWIIMTVYIKCCMLGQISFIWKNSGSRDMKKNDHGQSD